MVSGLLLRCSSCGNSAGNSSGDGDVNSYTCVDIQMIIIILTSDHRSDIAIDITIMKPKTPGPLPSSTFQTASKYCKHESQHLKKATLAVTDCPAASFRVVYLYQQINIQL